MAYVLGTFSSPKLRPAKVWDRSVAIPLILFVLYP